MGIVCEVYTLTLKHELQFIEDGKPCTARLGDPIKVCYTIPNKENAIPTAVIINRMINQMKEYILEQSDD